MNYKLTKEEAKKLALFEYARSLDKFKTVRPWMILAYMARNKEISNG